MVKFLAEREEQKTSRIKAHPTLSNLVILYSLGEEVQPFFIFLQGR
jgi:hypothetical protein